jgi:hypothetical protein
VAPQLLGDLTPAHTSRSAVFANFRGTYWPAFEWLSEVVFALAYAAGGWMGMVAIASAAAANAKPEKIYIAMQQKRRHFAA